MALSEFMEENSVRWELAREELIEMERRLNEAGIYIPNNPFPF